MDHRAVCFVIMPFGRKPDPSGRIVDFDRIYADGHRAGGRGGRPRRRARRRGEGRRLHPQADVRAHPAQRIRHRRSHHSQRQRLLRARHPPRGAAGNDRADHGAGIAAALRRRPVARAALCARRRRRADRRCGRERGADAAADRGARPSGDGLAAVPVARGLSGGADRPVEDRRLSHPGRLRRNAEEEARRRARRRRRGARRACATGSATSTRSRPASPSTCCCPIARCRTGDASSISAAGSTERCSARCWCASNGRWRSTGSAATARPRRS